VIDGIYFSQLRSIARLSGIEGGVISSPVLIGLQNKQIRCADIALDVNITKKIFEDESNVLFYNVLLFVNL